MDRTAGSRWQAAVAYAAGLTLCLVMGINPAEAASGDAKPATAPDAAKPAKPVKKRRPSQALECAAFTIHGVTTITAPEGSQEAGMYRATFGRLDLQAHVHAGHPVDYALTLDGHAMPPLTQLPPQALWPCLSVKGTGVRLSEQHQPCMGDRFQILLTQAGETADQYILLYRMAGNKPTARSWHFCRGAVLTQQSMTPPAAPAAKPAP